GKRKREQFTADRKMDELDNLWENDPARFLLYCLEDSRLVIDILDATGLIDLTLKRSELCGTIMSRAWASIHSFDHLYIGALHKQNFVAPDVGVDRLPISESPGGTILPPESGLFERVILLDFKGLYPSIIRTFGIDPLAYIAAQTAAEAGGSGESDGVGNGAAESGVGGADGGSGADEAVLRSPNGASFLRGKGILPELLTRFYHLREDAKRRGDDTASYAFKILANSFYGVLGSPACRFAGSDIATAITSFAREILYWSRDFVQELGYRVMYGDTDSLFLIPPGEVKTSDTFRFAAELADKLNSSLSTWVREKYRVESYLEIEFENIFAPFFIPPLKSVASQEIQERLRQAHLSGPQGRAKSYAGLSFTESGFRDKKHELVMKGMEAVRSDWTHLARKIQKDILYKIFTGSEKTEIAEYLGGIIRQIREPEGRHLLIIRKRLSKTASQYRGSLPPHVRAALIAEKQRSGKKPLRRIQYIMTADGPMPYFEDTVGADGAGADGGGADGGGADIAEADIGWYITKQVIPVLKSINAAVPYDLTAVVRRFFHPDGQLDLGVE
ncbi:MAG: DNA polymerase domain-containing protein, partial [Salinispira sp.]